MDREEVIQKFKEKESDFERLALNLRNSLIYLLEDKEIPYLDVYHRVKDLDSFIEKIYRKNYENPFNDTEDICGLRIVCYYPSDINKIKNIIYDEFIVNESEDKSESLEPNKFGYRSYHFIIQLKDEWSKVPNFRGLEDLKVELQVRTILMHAWADVSHKLSYKKKEHIPEMFQRKLFQLSALFEIADERFETLRKDREDYKRTLFNEKGEFDFDQELNLDSLTAFLDYYLPDRSRDDISNATLLDELIKYNITLQEVFFSYINLKEELAEIEKEVMGKRKSKFGQTGIIRHILDLTNDTYWNDRKRKFEGVPFNNNKVTEKQRKSLNLNK